jgi:hypothetical protein
MTKLNAKQTGMTLGLLFVLLDLVWIVLVGLGAGQGVCNWLMSLYFTSNPFTVAGLSLTTVLASLVATFVFGFVIGWLFAKVWNWTGTKKWAK